MKVKFKNKKAYNIAFTVVNGNAFCFRNIACSKTLEFFYEYSMMDALTLCNAQFGTSEDDYEIIK